MKKEPGFFSNLILSILLAVVAVYVLSFLNIVPNSMQVDLPHYMYPDVMPASGTRAYDAQKARERLGKKLHRELVELGLEEEEAGSKLVWYEYEKFAKPLGYSLFQQGYFTVGKDGEADKYYSPGPDGKWYVYNPKNKELSETSSEAASIPCSYEDLITFWISRDPSAAVSSDIPEILTEGVPGEDLKELATYGAGTFGHVRMTGLTFASLLQYQAAGRFLGFYDKTRTENRGYVYYLSDDRQYINRLSYDMYDNEITGKGMELDGRIISTVMSNGFYMFDADSRMVSRTSFGSEDYIQSLYVEEIASVPEGYTVPPIVGRVGDMDCCVFAGTSDVRMMDLGSGNICEVSELALIEGESFENISFVFGTDRLVLFYTTDHEPEEIKVSEVLYSSLED